MAEADDIKDQQEDSKEGSSDKKASKRSLLPWIIIAVVVALCAGAGFGLGRLFGGSGATETPSPSQQDQSTQAQEPQVTSPDLSGNSSDKSWYYDLEPVVANLDEPSVTRYVRVALTLEMDSQVDKKKGVAFIEEKKPLLTNWLTIYLAGLSLEDVRGDKNLKRIQSQILDAFNERLFPDSKPQIKRVLLKEFAIQ